MITGAITTLAIIAGVSYKYLTRKNRIPELALVDATDAHLEMYSDEYIQVMNERVRLAREKQAV